MKMDENPVFVVLSIANESGDILINCNALKKVQQILILAHHVHLHLDQHLFFSEDNNSSLYPVFTLKTILFLILLG